jgi:hypothetical protein
MVLLHTRMTPWPSSGYALLTPLPGTLLVDNTADAFRHCYGSGIMALQWGAGAAFGFGYRHEQVPFEEQSYAAQSMDLWNNYCGVLLGEKWKDWGMGMWHYRRDALQYACYAGAWNGTLVASPEDPRLKGWPFYVP